jgi:hypothetical protein
MSADFLVESLAILQRTPAVLDAALRGLPDAWTTADEGPNTWSPYVVLGHLIHGEKTDWLPRVERILQHGTALPFDTFDREAQFRDSTGKSLHQLLDEFGALRRKNLARLEQFKLQPRHLELQGTHPAFGPVSMRQLIATWTAHDLAHLLQITRVMAKRYKQEVGPWAAYLSVMA